MNLDHNQQFPNQRLDGDATECVALSVADICGNVDGRLYDPDMIYAYTLKLMNQEPNTGGLDPYTGMLTPIVYGLLPMELADWTAKTMGELYVANWQNYALEDRLAATAHVKRGAKPLYSYQDIISYMNRYQQGVSLAVKWYESFAFPDSNGVLPAPAGNFSYHNVAVYDSPLKGLQIKPWLGADFGVGGYCYMNQTVFNEIFQSAAGFDPNGWRWFSLATIAVTRPWAIPDILPLLKTA